MFPQRKMSLYYIVEIDVYNLLGNFGISVNFGPVLKFFATKFEVQQSADLQQQLYVQGKPGYISHSAPTALYIYTIECPLLTIPAGSDFAPKNSLTYLAINWINWQWQYMQNVVTVSNFPAILQSFDIDFSIAQGTQTIKIVSNRLLSDYIQAQYISDINPTTNYPVGARMLKNYDVVTNMAISVNGDYTNTFNILSGSNFYQNINYNIGVTTQIPVYIESAKFGVEFEFDKKNVINSFYSPAPSPSPSPSPINKSVVQDINGGLYPAVAFYLKNYKVTQSFGIVGQEAVTTTENFYGGDFILKSAQIVLGIWSGYSSQSVLYSYNLPFMVKSKTETIETENLIKTTIDFSFNGAQYPADPTLDYIGSPPVSPYNGYNILISSSFV
jgi:hypothetical protein